MSRIYEDANVYSNLGELSKPNEYELTTTTTPIGGGPTIPAKTSVKEQKKISWLLCLTFGCVINFILLMLVVSCLAYFLLNYMATKSDVNRISQELEVSKRISGSNESFGPPGTPGT